MPNDTAVSINVGHEVIQPIVEAKVQAALVEALGGKSLLMENAVSAILHSKVDSEGKWSSYNSAKPLIEWMAENLVKETAKQAVKEYLEKNKQLLINEFCKQFDKKKKTIAEQMVSGILYSAETTWSFNLNVNYKERNHE